MKMKVLASAMIVTLSMTSAYALQKPAGLITDHRIKVVGYDPNNVVQVNTHYGFTTAIQLADDEFLVQKPATGKAAGWQIGSQKNFLYLKPMADIDDTTDLTVVTNKHVYNFLLYASKAKETSAKQTFMIKFHYPEENQMNVLNSPQLTYNMIHHFGNPDAINREYSFKGNRSIAPVMAQDNGNFTLLMFKHKAPIPAIFSVDRNGNESQVNYRMQGRYLVIEGVNKQYTLRYGSQVVCLFNDKALEDWNKI